MDEIARDKRFAPIAKDPRFHQMKRNDRKVKIDKRFHGMFNDKRFKLKYTVDKRGRPVHTTTNENLRKYYDLSDSENSEDSDAAESMKKQKKKSDKRTVTAKSSSKHLREKEKKTMKKEESESEDSESEGEEQSIENGDSEREETENAEDSGKEEGAESQSESESEGSSKEDGVPAAVDFARGEGNIESSSDEDEDEDEDNFEHDKYDHGWGELDQSAPPAKEITPRLAVCNMDWDRIKAQDLFVLLSSFTSTGSSIKSVKIFPSEYGLKRMAEEEVKGPIELVQREENQDESDSIDQREKLRRYQLNRLRYYYAVVECDSSSTANKIYEECDGIEYESSATRLDLRFIPDDMVFDEKPKSVANSMPDTTTYKPTHFQSTALQQSKVALTWDETDKDRTAITMRKFTKEDLEELDVRDYLASSSGSEDEGDPYGGFIEHPDFGEIPEAEDEESTLAKYHEIIKGAQNTKEKEESKGNDVELEITWDPGLKDTVEKAAHKKAVGQTPWEEYLEKKKSKNKKNKKDKDGLEETKEQSVSEKMDKKKMKKQTALKEEEDVGKDAFSDDDLPGGLDLEDNYFKEELGGQNDKGKSKKISKKRRKKVLTADEEEEKRKQEAELSMILMDEDDNRKHFSLKGIMAEEAAVTSKAKKKKLRKMKKTNAESAKVQDTFQIDVKDQRFADVFENPLFNIDPSAPEYKETNATKALIGEKMRRRREKTSNGSERNVKRSAVAGSTSPQPAKQARLSTSTEPTSTKMKDLSLASLVKSVKAKTQTLQSKKPKSKSK